MRWKYYIPHVWDSVDARTAWEDVYLKREDEEADSSLWLTVDAGCTDEILAEKIAFWKKELEVEQLDERQGRWLHARDQQLYVLPNLDIGVREEDFDMHDLLEIARAFLTGYLGDPEPVLVAACREEFVGSNQHAEQVEYADRLASRLVDDEEAGAR